MKKKLCNGLMLLLMMFIMTGCVKFNVNIDVKKDKSMDFEIIYAVDNTYFGDEQLLEDDDKSELEDKGFKVSEYLEGNMEGFTISRSIKNIDVVSSLGDAEYNLGALFGDESDGDDSEYLFKVKKGLLKNTYIAKFKFDSSDSSLDDDTTEEDGEYVPNEDEVVDEDVTDSDTDIDGTGETDLGDMEDMMESMMESLDLSFNVNLPYPAISNNATEVTNDGKSLKWKLTTEDVSYMEFEFELYNMSVIYIGIGIIAVLILLILLIIVKKKKKNKSNNDEKKSQSLDSNVNQSEIVVNTDVNTTNVDNISSQVMPISGGLNDAVQQSDNTQDNGLNDVSVVDNVLSNNVVESNSQSVVTGMSNVQEPNVVMNNTGNDISVQSVDIRQDILSNIPMTNIPVSNNVVESNSQSVVTDMNNIQEPNVVMNNTGNDMSVQSVDIRQDILSNMPMTNIPVSNNVVESNSQSVVTGMNNVQEPNAVMNNTGNDMSVQSVDIRQDILSNIPMTNIPVSNNVVESNSQSVVTDMNNIQEPNVVMNETSSVNLQENVLPQVDNTSIIQMNSMMGKENNSTISNMMPLQQENVQNLQNDVSNTQQNNQNIN